DDEDTLYRRTTTWMAVVNLLIEGFEVSLAGELQGDETASRDTAKANFDVEASVAFLHSEMTSLEVHRKRLLLAESDEDRSTWWTDAKAFIESIWRVRNIASAVGKDHRLGAKVRKAVREFEVNAPRLKEARHVVAHLDAYSVGAGHLKSIDPSEVRLVEFDGVSLKWAGASIDLHEAFTAALKLKIDVGSAAALLLPKEPRLLVSETTLGQEAATRVLVIGPLWE
ncbi:MAG: hypothetical protein ACPHCI_07515, partial [Solirubrobacterales bacterium]